MGDNFKKVNQAWEMILSKTRSCLHEQSPKKRKRKPALCVGSKTSPMSHFVRTLRASNKSLTMSLRKMKEYTHQVHHSFTKLMQKNQDLKEQVLKLTGQDLPERFIEKAANKRFKERLGNVKKKIIILKSLAFEFDQHLDELFYMCLSGESSKAASYIGTVSPYSPPPMKKQFISATLSAADRACFASGRTCGRHEQEAIEIGFKHCNTYRKTQLPYNREKSYYCSSNYSSSDTSNDPWETLENASSGSSIQKKPSPVPELPVNFIKQKWEPNIADHRYARNTFVERGTSIDPEYFVRRETFTVSSDEFSTGKVLSDFALSHISYKPKLLTVGKKQKRLPGLPKKCRPKVWSTSSQEELNPFTLDNGRKQVSSETYLSDEKPTKFVKNKKRLSHCTKSNTDKKKSKKYFVKANLKHFDLSLSNVVDLVNARSNCLKKPNIGANYITTIQRKAPVHKVEKHTTFHTDDTEPLTSVGLPREAVLADNTCDSEGAETDYSNIRCSRKNEWKWHTEIVNEPFSDQGITTSSQPDQFCYMRKKKVKSGRISKNDTVIHNKMSLTQQKLKAGKRKISPKRKPLSVFGSKAKKEKMKSTVSPSPDQISALTPMSLGKNRSNSRNANRDLAELSSAQEADMKNNCITKKSDILLRENSPHEFMLSDIYSAAGLNYQTSSQSYDRKQDEQNSNREIRDQTPSKIKRVPSETRNGGSVTIDYMLQDVCNFEENVISRSAPVNLCCSKPQYSEEIFNEDDK